MSVRRGLDDRGVSSPLVIMQGNGGLMSAQTAARQPVALIRSGPAAGVAGAAYLAGLAEEHNIITLDMGGTSTDVAVFAGERPPPVRDWDVFSFPIRWTALDIRSIGAGGGSIAWIDGGGLLKVGPQSAGAEPGPSCYERGGVIATVTDATVVLSRIGPNALLGGSIVVNAERARSAIEDLARSLGYEVEETAAGIIEIVNAAIAQEIHLICAERGFPARDYTLVAFGGAGGLHASEVAAELGIQKVLVPARPGLLCALGVLTSVPRADFGITRLMPMLPGDPQLAAEFEAVRSNVTQRATQWLEEQRIPSRSVDLEWTAELRYRGQNYELPVKMPSGPIDGDLLIAEFHAQHEHTYGYRSEAVEVQCVAVRLLLSIDVDHPALRPSVTQKVSVVSAPRRLVHMGRRWGFVDSAIYRREEMPIGSIFTGPAIVEQMDATTLILPDQRGLVDPWGNIMLTKRETA
jgi:N-methylhydantoinase A